MSVPGARAFALHLGLGPVPADVDDVLAEMGDRLDAHEPLLSEGETGLELSLTVVASDLWVAVLLAMAAVTDVGYAVVRLEARPAERRAGRPPTAAPDTEPGQL